MTNNKPCTPDGMLILELATENAQLGVQLAEVQDQCIELAADAGDLHAEVEALRAEVEELRANAAKVAVGRVGAASMIYFGWQATLGLSSRSRHAAHDPTSS